MTKKRVLFGVAIILLILAGYYLYLTLKPPTAFLTDEQLLTELNRYDQKLQTEVIVNKQQLDARHYYVPIELKDGKSGMSFWKWYRGDWKLLQITTHPFLRWQLDDKDASTIHFVWHQQSKQESTLPIYLIADRSYHVSNDVHRYEPRVQLESAISVTAYGAKRIPSEWATIMTSTNQPFIQDKFDFFQPYQGEHYTIYAQYLDIFTVSSNRSYLVDHAKSKIDYVMYIEGNQME